MKFALIIYLMDVLGSIKIFTALFLSVSLVCGVLIAALFLSADDMGPIEFWKKRSKPVLILMAFICFIQILVPSQKTAYTMLAAYGIQQAVDNPQVQDIAGDSLKVINRAMKKYLDESEDEPNNSTKGNDK